MTKYKRQLISGIYFALGVFLADALTEVGKLLQAGEPITEFNLTYLVYSIIIAVLAFIGRRQAYFNPEALPRNELKARNSGANPSDLEHI